ncbi:MAG: hypothetical protein KDA80_09650 [Planctomycetaceae bacterium]|nr:hypothetical protein [Planctomycetaceae bacterium]
MAGNHGIRPDKRSGPLLASALVVFLGGLGVAIIMAAGGADPAAGLTIFGAGLGLIFCLALLGRAVPSTTLSDLYGWVTSKDSRPAVDYEPRAVGQRRHEYGTNRPPTAEEVREMKESPNCWVPNSLGPPRRRNKGA